MTRSKWIGFAVAMGILIAVTGVSIYMPKMIQWYFEPPSNIGVSCGPSIEWAFHRFQVAQLYGVLGGAIVGLILGIRFTAKKGQSLPPQV